MVSLVGAGPGDPELITVKGLNRLRQAEVVLFDRLVHHDLVESAHAAQKVLVGKSNNPKDSWSQEEINNLLVKLGKQRKRVVRLKGGDPFVFGRGGEEALALAFAGLDFEVIPGISSSIAAPSSALIPVTHRGLAQSFAVFTASNHGNGSVPEIDWQFAVKAPTAIFLMGVKNLSGIAGSLIAHGKSPLTPTAVISKATLPDEKTVFGSLQEIGELAKGLEAPATFIVGEVANIPAEIQMASAAFGKQRNASLPR